MKLWILRPIEELEEHNNPWSSWYDKAFGFVVRAKTEEEAREVANTHAGDENYEESLDRGTVDTITPWTDSRYSTCTELTSKGKSEMILRDFASA